MSLATLERAILAELRAVTGRAKLRKKDIMEWSTGPVKPRVGETVYVLPDLGINVVVAPASK